METQHPLPGDLIQVHVSLWYALKDGQQLRVCETPGWATAGCDIYVAPRHQVRSFYGPDCGPPDGVKRERLSTSGGPFKTLALRHLQGLRRIGPAQDEFWHWLDYPRAGGGVDYQRDITLWELDLLDDRPWSDSTEDTTFHEENQA